MCRTLSLHALYQPGALSWQVRDKVSQPVDATFPSPSLPSRQSRPRTSQEPSRTTSQAPGQTLGSQLTGASGQAPSTSELPPTAPRRKDSAFTMAEAPGPSPGGRPHPAWLCPARAPTRPSLVRLLVQRFHVAGPAGSGAGFLRTRPHGPPSGFGLPVSGPPLPYRLRLPPARLTGGDTREGKGTRKEARTRRLTVVRGSASGGGLGGIGFGGRLSSALSQALARAGSEYRREVLRARLEASGRIPALPCRR